MTHSPLQLNNLGLFFSAKSCFENVTASIHYGSRIAIIGRNGGGKSTLLKILKGEILPSEGSITVPKNVRMGYVPQIVEEFDALSGGQRFNKALTQALLDDPNVLLLDEPTNHLDAKNRTSLLRMLKAFTGTLIIVSHDLELLRSCVNSFWHIVPSLDVRHPGRIEMFSGTYDDYMQHQATTHQAQIEKKATLKKEQQKTRKDVQFEQKRAAQSRRANQDENDRTLKGAMKQSGSSTASKKQGKIQQAIGEVNEQLKDCYIPKVIHPTFSLTAALLQKKPVITIRDGACGYQYPVLQHINLSVGAQERIALRGDNGSGKTTLVKAMLSDASICKSGEWTLPERGDIGYLDQHYATLDSQCTVFDAVHNVVPSWASADVRRHLNDFLFSKNEQVMVQAKTLSGGEKARLSLAVIAAQTPRVLILDEITNNLDLETREHVIQVLREYPGALVVISHDADFLEALAITSFYVVADGGVKNV